MSTFLVYTANGCLRDRQRTQRLIGFQCDAKQRFENVPNINDVFSPRKQWKKRTNIPRKRTFLRLKARILCTEGHGAGVFVFCSTYLWLFLWPRCTGPGLGSAPSSLPVNLLEHP
ncbi:hypothetical protein COCON_G00162130 [Conger conger]|uniref:Uncharacterized protein n=1 Tax=Conger conger TaxID=82655 RepID=A0A9Q1D6S9_CONCO|nr:hypothetical protein COCON_G00162130 [Conger conger]